MGNVEDFVEFGFEFARVGTELPRGNHVKWAFEQFGNALGCEGFACTRGAVEDGDEATTFALDDVVNIAGGLEGVGLDEGFDDRLLVVGQDKGVECAFVPFDVVDAGNGEFEPELLAEGEPKHDRGGDEEFFFGEDVVIVAAVGLGGEAIDVFFLDLVAIVVHLHFDDVGAFVFVNDELHFGLDFFLLGFFELVCRLLALVVRRVTAAAAIIVRVFFFGLVNDIGILGLDG